MEDFRRVSLLSIHVGLMGFCSRKSWFKLNAFKFNRNGLFVNSSIIGQYTLGVAGRFALTVFATLKK